MSVLDKILPKRAKIEEAITNGPILISPNAFTERSLYIDAIEHRNVLPSLISTEPYTSIDRRKEFDKIDYLGKDSIQATSMARFFDETFNPYKFSKFRELYLYDEPSFYRDYAEAFLQNPWANMVIMFLVNEIFANGAHFEGSGAKATEDFFWKDDTWNKLKLMTTDGFVKGNGFMDLRTKNKRLQETVVVPAEYVAISFDVKSGKRLYYSSLMKENGPLDASKLGHFMPREISGVAYGMSLFRPNYVFLQALLDASGDVMAAIKRTGYAPIVVKLDLEELKDDDKKTAMSNYKTALQEIQSSTNNFIIDKRHDINLLGQGAAGARLLPTNDMLMPIISVILMNFGVPLGLFLQTGANKSIIDEQRKAMQRYYEEIRIKLKHFVETMIIPKITDADCVLVFNKPPVNSEETQKGMEIHSKLFETGLISREFFLSYWDIEDSGTTFYEPPVKETPNKEGDMNEESRKEKSKE